MEKKAGAVLGGTRTCFRGAAGPPQDGSAAPLAATPGQTWWQQCRAENKKKYRKPALPSISLPLRPSPGAAIAFAGWEGVTGFGARPLAERGARRFASGAATWARRNDEQFRAGCTEFDAFWDFSIDLSSSRAAGWWHSKCWSLDTCDPSPAKVPPLAQQSSRSGLRKSAKAA